MGESSVGVAQLKCCVCITVEREQTPCGQGLRRHRVVEVLTSRIAVDLDGHSVPRRFSEDLLPPRHDPGPGSADAATRVCEDVDVRRAYGGEQTIGLVLAPAEP